MEGFKKFAITRVVTKNIVMDSFQWVRNLFGLRLRGYEDMINREVIEITEEAELKYMIKWYSMSINPLTKGSCMITIYGEGIEYE